MSMMNNTRTRRIWKSERISALAHILGSFLILSVSTCEKCWKIVASPLVSWLVLRAKSPAQRKILRFVHGQSQQQFNSHRMKTCVTEATSSFCPIGYPTLPTPLLGRRPYGMKVIGQLRFLTLSPSRKVLNAAAFRLVYSFLQLEPH